MLAWLREVNAYNSLFFGRNRKVTKLEYLFCVSLFFFPLPKNTNAGLCVHLAEADKPGCVTHLTPNLQTLEVASRLDASVLAKFPI